MDVTAIPFHQYLGLESASPPNLLMLQSRHHHTNHLGTIHASVLIALAEAASGVFLQQHLSDGTEQVGVDIFPMIRRIEAKFHQGGHGTIYARSSLDPVQLHEVQAELASRHRAKVQVPMKVVDAHETLLLSVTFDWFLTRKAP